MPSAPHNRADLELLRKLGFDQDNEAALALLAQHRADARREVVREIEDWLVDMDARDCADKLVAPQVRKKWGRG